MPNNVGRVTIDKIDALADNGEDAMDAAILPRILEDPHQEIFPFELIRRIRERGTSGARLA